MTQQQTLAGRQMWQRTGQKGRLASSSLDAESMAPKTWVMWVNNKGEEISTVECELYVAGRHIDRTEGVGMLHGLCPKCGESFIVREDNKGMAVEYAPYRKAPKHIKVNWAYHCKNVLGRMPREEDKIAVVSSPERWACDYCREWCVKVTEGIATTDMTGVTQVIIHGRPQLVGRGSPDGESIPVLPDAPESKPS